MIVRDVVNTALKKKSFLTDTLAQQIRILIQTGLILILLFTVGMQPCYDNIQQVVNNRFSLTNSI